MRPDNRGMSGTVQLLLAASVGLVLGIGGYTFMFAKGFSYLSNNPASCVNCHIMREQFTGWQKSSHHAVAVCNDCHTPHTFFGKYLTKAINGFNHSVAFTTGVFHEPIQITSRNEAVTEGTCRSCHEPIVQQIDLHGGPSEGGISCIRCHRSVGHLHLE